MKIPLNLLLITSMISFFYSCNNDAEVLNGKQPEIPQAAIYDFNEDLINDFRIAYFSGTWDGYDSEGNPAGGDMITGDIEPLSGNSVWCIITGGWLFLQPGDTLYSDNAHDTTMHFWTDFPVVLVTTDHSRLGIGLGEGMEYCRRTGTGVPLPGIQDQKGQQLCSRLAETENLSGQRFDRDNG